VKAVSGKKPFMNKKLNSILLIIGIAVVAAVMLIGYTMYVNGIDHPQLEITVNNKRYGVYDLDEDRTIKINDTNICEIQDGEVSMTWADCPDQICVNSVSISSSGGSIVCMPNMVVLRIINADDSGSDTPDSIAG
jgi:hypothetical protein